MPVLEMWVLIKVGGVIGAWPTIGFVLLTAAVGYALLRKQGFATLLRGQQRLQQGELPAREMVEGLVLAVAGALLLTPGFVTDILGFLGLVSPLRAALADGLLKRAVMGGKVFDIGRFDDGVNPMSGRPGGKEGDLFGHPSNPEDGSRKGDTYEGDYERKE